MRNLLKPIFCLSRKLKNICKNVGQLLIASRPKGFPKEKKTIMRYQTNAKSKHYDIFCLEKGQNGRCQRPSVSGSVLGGSKCLVSVEVQLTAHSSCHYHTSLKRAKPHSHSHQTGGRCSSPPQHPFLL